MAAAGPTPLNKKVWADFVVAYGGIIDSDAGVVGTTTAFLGVTMRTTADHKVDRADNLKKALLSMGKCEGVEGARAVLSVLEATCSELGEKNSGRFEKALDKVATQLRFDFSIATGDTQFPHLNKLHHQLRGGHIAETKGASGP